MAGTRPSPVLARLPGVCAPSVFHLCSGGPEHAQAQCWHGFQAFALPLCSICVPAGRNTPKPSAGAASRRLRSLCVPAGRNTPKPSAGAASRRLRSLCVPSVFRRAGTRPSPVLERLPGVCVPSVFRVFQCVPAGRNTPKPSAGAASRRLCSVCSVCSMCPLSCKIVCRLPFRQRNSCCEALPSFCEPLSILCKFDQSLGRGVAVALFPCLSVGLYPSIT